MAVSWQKEKKNRKEMTEAFYSLVFDSVLASNRENVRCLAINRGKPLALGRQ
jgi:hypothetical protein